MLADRRMKFLRRLAYSLLSHIGCVTNELQNIQLLQLLYIRQVEAVLRTYVYTGVLLNNSWQFADLGRNLALFFNSLALPNEQPFPKELLTLQNKLQMVKYWKQIVKLDRNTSYLGQR